MFNDRLTLRRNTFKDGSGSVNSLLCIALSVERKYWIVIQMVLIGY